MSGTTNDQSVKVKAAMVILLLICFIVVYNRKYISRQVHPEEQTLAAQPRRTHAAILWNRLQVDSAAVLAMDGDLVARTGNDGISDIYRRINTHDPTYSHAGIVFRENGALMVYHISGGAENPGGYLRRDSLSSYIAPRKNLGFGLYRLPANKSQRVSLHDNAVRYFRERRRFDLRYDLHTDRELYGAEFIYKLVNESFKKPIYTDTTKSDIQDWEYVTVDNLLALPAIKVICKVRYKQ